MLRESTTRSNRNPDTARIEAEIVELCREHLASLARYATTLTQKNGIIQNALQEAFLRYFIVKADGRTIDNPRIWLTCAVKSYITDRESDAAVDSQSASSSGTLPQKADPVADQATAFRRALASLTRREQECLRLHIEGYVYHEIAQILRMKRSAVGALLCDVLARFRKDRGMVLPRRVFTEGLMDTHYVIAHLRLVWAETQYRRRVHRRVYTYLCILGLLTAAAAVAAVFIK